MSTVHKLERVIRDQLFDEISRSSYDIGYIQGSHTVTIRNKEDLIEVWSSIKKGSNIILWCDGLKKKSAGQSKKAAISSDSSDNDEEEVQETVMKERKRAKSTDEEEVGETRMNRSKGKTRTKKCEQQSTSSQKSMVIRAIHLCNIVCG